MKTIDQEGIETTEIQTLASAGVTLRLIKDIFEINLPIIETKNIVDNHNVQGRDNFPKRINFVLQLHNFHLFNDLDNLRFF